MLHAKVIICDSEVLCHVQLNCCLFLYLGLVSELSSNSSNNSNDNKLCYLYPYPCPKKFYKLPAVLFCYTVLFYKLAWAWERV